VKKGHNRQAKKKTIRRNRQAKEKTERLLERLRTVNSIWTHARGRREHQTQTRRTR
jgi:hypothetical protein